MTQDLLHYYERELAWLKQAGADFTAAHPAVAGNLGLHNDIVEDPHVSRLIESVAFLNARIQQSLDEDFPQISDALLEHLYPQHLAPIPAMTVVEMIANDGDVPLTIPAHSVICTPPVNGVSCQFRTVYPVTLLPLCLRQAQLMPAPLHTPGAGTARHAAAVLVLQLQANSDDFNFAASNADRLRLFLRTTPYAWQLHALLTDHCMQITVAGNDPAGSIAAIDTGELNVAGFSAEEALLPAAGSVPNAFHHLAEFLHFPSKFLFFDLQGLAAATASMRGNISLYFYLDASNRELERNIDAGFFSLTATPIVNLFSHLAEPISLTSARVEYPLVADARNCDAYEVHAIQQMTRIDELSGERCEMMPFFGMKHDGGNTCYWHLRREISQRDSGMDCFVAFSDITCQAVPANRAVVQPRLLCSNRDLPVRLAMGSLEFRLRNDDGRVRQIRSLLPMTAPVRKRIGNGARWRLLSHINGSLTGLSATSDGTRTLRDILSLHDADDNATTRALISAIDDVQFNGVMLPLRCHGRVALCRGIDICITFNDSRLAGTSLTLYGMVLEHFLAQSVNLNGFVRVSLKRKDQTAIIRRGQPRTGTRPLL